MVQDGIFFDPKAYVGTSRVRIVYSRAILTLSALFFVAVRVVLLPSPSVFAHFADAGQIKRLQAHGDRQRRQFKRIGRKLSVYRHRVQKQQAVLAPGYADGELIARLNHVKISICLTG